MFHNCFLMYVKEYFGLFSSVDRVHPNDIFKPLHFLYTIFWYFFLPSIPPIFIFQEGEKTSNLLSSFLSHFFRQRGKRRTKIKGLFSSSSFSVYLQFLSSILFFSFSLNMKKRLKITDSDFLSYLFLE